MKSYPNLEKSGFDGRQYVGYGGGKVWRIAGGTGNWRAVNQANGAEVIRSPLLGMLSDKLAALDLKKNPIEKSTRKPDASDLNAAARGLGMIRMSADELRELIARYKHSPDFAGQVIAFAARDMLRAKKRVGLIRNPRQRKPIFNRWGTAIVIGENYYVQTPRDGKLGPYVVAKIETTGNYARAYGSRVIFEHGGSAALDDLSPVTIKRNPRPRIGTSKPNRASSATGKAPGVRLVKRRKKNSRKGFFPNPKKQYVVEMESLSIIGGNGKKEWQIKAVYGEEKPARAEALRLLSKFNRRVRVLVI